MRALVLTCVAFMLLELVLVITKHESTPSRLVVLVDTSESMALNDPYPEDEAHSSLAGKLGFDGPAAIRKQSRLALGQRALEKTHREIVRRAASVALWLFAKAIRAQAGRNRG